ncbi:MAG: HDIG domain-containing protein [Desulfovibrio sp.]|jgi:putative nucleotidyltransferase with HDIG domain|nr:HDIG domain-containing protein [Desulfovibrio sp.]
MTNIKKIPDKAGTGFSQLLTRLGEKLPPWGFYLLVASLVLLSVPAAVDLTPRPDMLREGSIAPADIVADSSFLYRDDAATRARQDLVRKMQPLVLDFASVPVEQMHRRVQRIFIDANEALELDEQEALRAFLSREMNRQLTTGEIGALTSRAMQDAALQRLLPIAASYLNSGVLQEIAVISPYPGGVVVRNRETGEEKRIEESFALPDIRRLELLLSQEIRGLSLSNDEKRMLDAVFDDLLYPSLLPNYEVTKQRADALADAVEPVTHRVQRGEVIIRQGEKVSAEQELKMQIFLQNKEDRFNTKLFLGTALFALLTSAGLLFSPSGSVSARMENRDFIFLAVLMAIFVLLAKAIAVHGEQLAAVSGKFLPESLVFAVPVAGAASLAAQIFAARRYLVTGILLAFFCTITVRGSMALFLFYFLSAMWSTRLTNRSAARRDVVRSVLPLAVGLTAMWGATTMIQGGAHTRYLSELLALLGGGAFCSMVITFALTPLVEMVFGYTTRFRLMELMNLEQPLLRDLMMLAPGTYHHSLVVANMSEAGAKRVDAHAMLCKVGALYHDIGKSLKSGYFIENQGGAGNPHDRLAPSMSALILISHVKQGIELAEKHRLGREITDIIGQHHGTGLIRYFFDKAAAMPDMPPPAEGDFKYPGPKPQSKEAAIVMLADIIEASSRTLVDPSPARLAQHIDGVMKNVYSSGQLDQCDLTLRDLHALTDSFNQMLLGLHHQRISYQPPQDKSAPPRLPALKPAGEADPGLAVRVQAAESAVPGERVNEPATPRGPGNTAALRGRGSGETAMSSGRKSKVIRMKNKTAQFEEADARHS